MLYGLKNLRKVNPDLVHIHGVGPAFPLAVHPKILGNYPVVVTAHGVDWDRDKWAAPAKRLFKAVSVRGLKNASVVTAVSQTVAAELSLLLDAQVDYTPNGIDTPSFTPATPEGLERGQYSVCVSRLTPEKNIEQVLTAYDESVVRELGKLYVIGDGAGSYTVDYVRKLERLSHGGIEFLGRLSHDLTLRFVANSGRFISASRIEAQPISILESMSYGGALYLSDIPPHVELCERGARYFKLDSPNGVKSLLLASERDEVERQMREVNLSKTKRLSWQAAVDEYEVIYRCAVRTSVDDQLVSRPVENMKRESIRDEH